jgi:DNA segregation ATPase FtsK/SpoIIIE-like protein
VLEFVEGADLEHWLAALGRPPTQEELDELVAPLLDALEVVHEAAILHRDIKPANIFIRETDNTPVLIDFGAARYAVGEYAGTTAAIVSRGYSPHEAYATDSRLQGPWTDIYGLAATIYKAISGSPPPEATSRVLNDELVPAVALPAAEAYRPEFLAAIDAGMALMPSDRPRSVGEWRQLLFTGLIGEDGSPISRPRRSDLKPGSPVSGPQGLAGSTADKAMAWPSLPPRTSKPTIERSGARSGSRTPAASTSGAKSGSALAHAGRPRLTLVVGVLLMLGGGAAIVGTRMGLTRSDSVDPFTGSLGRAEKTLASQEAARVEAQRAAQQAAAAARQEELEVKQRAEAEAEKARQVAARQKELEEKQRTAAEAEKARQEAAKQKELEEKQRAEAEAEKARQEAARQKELEAEQRAAAEAEKARQEAARQKELEAKQRAAAEAEKARQVAARQKELEEKQRAEAEAEKARQEAAKQKELEEKQRAEAEAEKARQEAAREKELEAKQRAAAEAEKARQEAAKQKELEEKQRAEAEAQKEEAPVPTQQAALDVRSQVPTEVERAGYLKQVQTALKAYKCYSGEINGDPDDARSGLTRFEKSYEGQVRQINLATATVGDYQDWLNWSNEIEKFSCPSDKPRIEPERGERKKVHKPKEEPRETKKASRPPKREARSAPPRAGGAGGVDPRDMLRSNR